MKKALKWLALGFLGLVILTAVTNGGSSDSSTSSADAATSGADKNDDAKQSKSESADSAKSCGTKATDDCTPHVGTKGSVRVDALTWKVRSVSTAREIGRSEFSDGTKADGTFVIVKLAVKSHKNESATLTDDVVKLKIGKAIYSSDTDGAVAQSIEDGGNDSLLLEDISPDSTMKGTAVFDVPTTKLGKKMELQFGELGFGSTKGFIAMRSVA